METAVIEKVIPKTRTYKFEEKEIQVKQFKLRHIPKVSKLFKSVYSKIAGKTDNDALTLAVLEMLETDFDSIMEALEMSTGLKLEELEKIEEKEPDKLIEIISSVVEVNKDFLGRVTKMLQFSK